MKKWMKYSMTLAVLCIVFLAACFAPELLGIYRDSSYMGKVKEYKYDNTFAMYEQAEGKEENWNLMKQLQRSGREIQLVSTSDLLTDWGMVYNRFQEELKKINNTYSYGKFTDFMLEECELQYTLQEGTYGSRACYRIYALGADQAELVTALIDKETYGIYYFYSVMETEREELIEQYESAISVSGTVTEEDIYNHIFGENVMGKEYKKNVQTYYNDMVNLKEKYGEESSDSKKADCELQLILLEEQIPIGFECGFVGLRDVIDEFDRNHGFDWKIEDSFIDNEVWEKFYGSYAVDGGDDIEEEQEKYKK